MRDILDPGDIWVGTPGTVFLNRSGENTQTDTADTLLNEAA